MEFQFTCPSRSTTTDAAAAGAIWFQFTCPSRSTTVCPLFLLDVVMFQFTCPSRSTTGLVHRKGLSRPGFNSRAPRGARPELTLPVAIVSAVSIHVPLAEHDVLALQTSSAWVGFNSRAPRGARLTPNRISTMRGSFQFTCPSRSTTAVGDCAGSRVNVSIHVPLAEHDFESEGVSGHFEVSIHVPLAEHDRTA